jgi:hypothetical protein
MSGSIAKIARELAAATSAKKCHACGCFQDAVAALQRTELASSLAVPASEASSVFVERRYDCLGLRGLLAGEGFQRRGRRGRPPCRGRLSD